MTTTVLERPLLQTLNLVDARGSDLTDEAETASLRIRQALRNRQDPSSIQQRVKITSQGFESWRDSLQNFTPSEQQRETALQHRGRTLDALNQFCRSSNNIVRAIKDSNITNAIVLSHIRDLDEHIITLNGLFPDAWPESAQAVAAASATNEQASQQQTRPDWENYDWSRNASQPELTQSPPGQRSQSSFTASQGGPFSNFVSREAHPRLHIRHAESIDDGFMQNGYHFATPADAAAQPNLPGMIVDRVIVGGNSRAINGNVYGSHPFAQQQQQQQEQGQQGQHQQQHQPQYSQQRRPRWG